MNLSDLIALAKQGYKPSDIKELIALGKDAQTTGGEKPAETAPKEVTQPEPEKPVEKPAPAETGETEKIKELEAQLSQVRKDLEKAQQNNIMRNNSGAPAPDPQKTFDDLVRSFM